MNEFNLATLNEQQRTTLREGIRSGLYRAIISGVNGDLLAVGFGLEDVVLGDDLLIEARGERWFVVDRGFLMAGSEDDFFKPQHCVEKRDGSGRRIIQAYADTNGVPPGSATDDGGSK